MIINNNVTQPTPVSLCMYSAYIGPTMATEYSVQFQLIRYLYELLQGLWSKILNLQL